MGNDMGNDMGDAMDNESSGDMHGKRVLVVGASSGIGAAVARGAARRGARVAVCGRRVERLEELSAVDPAIFALCGDVRDEASIRSVVARAAEAFGGLDAVVYAVGVSPLKSLAEATQDDWRAVLDSNLIGAALVSAASAPHLIASGGRLLLLSSKSVRRPFPDLSLYATSKIALDGLIRCLPGEFPGLRVCRIVVGNTLGTEFATGWNEADLSAAVERWAASGVLGESDGGGLMEPEHVADTILHVLVSPAHLDDVAVLDHG